MESWTEVKYGRKAKAAESATSSLSNAIPSKQQVLKEYDARMSSTTIYHRKYTRTADGALECHITIAGIMKTSELVAASAWLSKRKIEDNKGGFEVIIDSRLASEGAVRALIEILNPLRLPVKASFKGKKEVRTLPSWDIYQIAQVYQAATLFELEEPFSLMFIRTKLWQHASKKQTIEPAVVAEIWRCTNKQTDAKLRHEAVSNAFNRLKCFEAPRFNGPLHEEFVAAFRSQPALLQAYHDVRSRFISTQATQIKKQGQKMMSVGSAEQKENQAWMDEQDKKLAFEVAVADRRGVSTISRDF